jgi:hypothetical protein
MHTLHPEFQEAENAGANGESPPESWSPCTGAIFNCFVAQNRINFTKFDHGFRENTLMANKLSSLCTKNEAGKSLSRRSMARGRGKDDEMGAILVRISVMV